MSQALVLLLLFLALVVPIIGALAVRLLADRLSEEYTVMASVLVVAVAIISVFALANRNIDRIQIGNLNLVLPVARPAAMIEAIEAAPPELPATPLPPTDTPLPTATPSPSPSATATTTPLLRSRQR
ncbi:MAG: hypothetical protein HC914_05715 [Chloroflexaceae bacterium]|nr:hypothetical protein [Chloroflexaceae bacterium]